MSFWLPTKNVSFVGPQNPTAVQVRPRLLQGNQIKEGLPSETQVSQLDVHVTARRHKRVRIYEGRAA